MTTDFPSHAAFTFLNQSREVFVIADAAGTLRYVSPSAANLFGFKNVDVLGKPATHFIHPGAQPCALRRQCFAASVVDADMRRRPRAMRRESRADACSPLLADDHEALGALCADAVANVSSRDGRRLRHRTTAAGAFVPMDCRACFDGELLYVVRPRASVAA